MRQDLQAFLEVCELLGFFKTSAKELLGGAVQLMYLAPARHTIALQSTIISL